ncbi:hypothetical protein NDU88_005200 [Pleurodeles waltl]|uniref:Uncharacterized protein n=1 Tax=Pleurodeles waltl TaxID=8319 RepID=A0AAV7VL22_PLEWA|nr:hypothetical protein NDU88_005200 [Pleurodeles waltl]
MASETERLTGAPPQDRVATRTGHLNTLLEGIARHCGFPGHSGDRLLVADAMLGLTEPRVVGHGWSSLKMAAVW